MVSYQFKIYIPTYAQGRLQISIGSQLAASSIPIHLLSADILSAGINVGSFMPEYVLGNKYVWTYSSDVIGSTYNNRAYLDLGVVTNTGTSTESVVPVSSTFAPSFRNIGNEANVFQCNG